jgi:hypothetical protein
MTRTSRVALAVAFTALAMAGLVSPCLRRARDRQAEALQLRQLRLLAAALDEFWTAHGAPPASLADLLPHLHENVPLHDYELIVPPTVIEEAAVAVPSKTIVAQSRKPLRGGRVRGAVFLDGHADYIPMNAPSSPAP